jgi:hypothetical protein
MEDSIEDWLQVEFNHAKYSLSSWGRSVVHAIDMDDCFALFNASKITPLSGADLNTQVNTLGYDQYLWTSAVHNYIGDTALHLALRQNKMMCVHMLLILKVKTNIVNAFEETAESMCMSMFNTDIKNLAYEAIKFILNRIDLKDIPRLPDLAQYRNVEKEAWDLMWEGRVCYTELPKSFMEDDKVLEKHLAVVRKDFLSFNYATRKKKPAAGGDFSSDVGSKPKVKYDRFHPEPPPSNPADWSALKTDVGHTYYYNKVLKLYSFVCYVCFRISIPFGLLALDSITCFILSR